MDTVGFADSTIGAPVEIAVTMSPGSVSCERAAATRTRTPAGGGTPTVGPGGLPPTGSGGSHDNGTLPLLVASLASVGVAIIGGFQLRRRRS